MNAEFANVLAEMQADFIDGLPDRCARIEEQLLALERGQQGAFDELYRLVHSLKGAGGMFGLPIVSTICHQFETYVGENHAQFSKAVVNTALAYLDLIRRTAVPAGREPESVAAIERELDAMRTRSLQGRVSLLLAEPSEVLRRLYHQTFAEHGVHAVIVDNGMVALERLLHEPFDLFVASRELPGLNALGVLAAVREAGQRNSDIEAVIVTSNTAPMSPHLRIGATLPRDPKLTTALLAYVQRQRTGKKGVR